MERDETKRIIDTALKLGLKEGPQGFLDKSGLDEAELIDYAQDGCKSGREITITLEAFQTGFNVARALDA